MRIFLFPFIFFFLISTNLGAVSYNSDPKIFISELVDDAIKTLRDDSISLSDKKATIEKIASENVDIKALGLYTLGDLRKKLEKNKIDEYQLVFKKYFLKSLTSRLTTYSSQKFEVLGANVKNEKYTIVLSRIAESKEQPEIKVDWRVYTKNPEKPLIRDLIIEGLSLARTQKEEFNSVIQSNNGNINALFINLENFIKN